MSRPDLTVVISTHARPVEVRQALESVRDQELDGVIETIIVWDKADPEPELASNDTRRPVRVMKNHRTPGLPGSRNSGVDEARAPIVGFSDDDDLWLPGKAQKQLELLERTGAPAVASTIEIWHTDGRTYPRESTGSAARFEDLIRSRIPEASMATVLVRRDAFLGPIGPVDEQIPGGYAEDYEWWLRATRHAPIPLVQEPLYRVRWGSGTFFRDQWDLLERATQYVLDEFPEFADDPKGYAKAQGKRAFALAAQGKKTDARRTIATVVRANPLEPRATLAALVLAGMPAERILGFLNSRGRGI